MNKTNISRIISGKPDRGLNKYMLEEVYFSDSCFNKDQYNPQNARFINGRYYYDFPDFWYNHLSNNKAIALRKIDLRAETLNLQMTITVKRFTAGTTNPSNKFFTVAVVVQPNMSTFSILQEICRKVNPLIAPNGRSKWASAPDRTVELVPVYNYETSEAIIELKRTYEVNPQSHYFSMKISDLNKDAEFFFKKKNAELPPYEECTYDKDGTFKYTFPGVWNREFLFVHASFVNGTSFNYLGRSSEFYPKPSKMYRFGGSSQQFYFEVSYDGRTPIKDRIGVFTIDLAFIYHDKDYQAE